MVVGGVVAADPALCEQFWRGRIRERGRDETRLQAFTRLQRLQRLVGGTGAGNEVVVVFSKPMAKAVATRLLSLTPGKSSSKTNQRLRSAIAQLRGGLGN